MVSEPQHALQHTLPLRVAFRDTPHSPNYPDIGHLASIANSGSKENGTLCQPEKGTPEETVFCVGCTDLICTRLEGWLKNWVHLRVSCGNCYSP